LLYFAPVTNHYLHLVKVSSTIPVVSNHDMKYPIIADSGANYHIFKEREFFEILHPATGRRFAVEMLNNLSLKFLKKQKLWIIYSKAYNVTTKRSK
jgi:hypothetical protein